MQDRKRIGPTIVPWGMYDVTGSEDYDCVAIDMLAQERKINS